jgi:FAD/FMN-containing dehydrogenase
VALRASTSGDIAAGARWAADAGLGIALRATGHGARSTDHDALVINTSALATVAVDAGRGRAAALPGAQWSHVSAASLPHGLVGLEGGSPTVGVVGYTVGGGLGPIGRTFGFAADRVRSFDVLDAHYDTVTVDDGSGDVFWALRGAGGIAIVTRVEFDLVPLPRLFGGGLYFDGRDAATVIEAYAAWAAGLDERTTTSIALVRLPPAPELPDVLRGRFVVHVRIAHVDPGSTDIVGAGRRILAPMCSCAPVLVDATRGMTGADLPDIHRDPVAPQRPAYTGALLDRLDAAALTAVAADMDADPSAAPVLVELRQLGGAYARQPASPDCATGRSAAFNLYISARASAADPAVGRSIADTTRTALTTSTRAQLNFAGPAPAPGEVLRLWSPADAARILSVQRTLDPDNRVCTGRPLR